MPLIVKDPRGVLTRRRSIARTQLTSSVDVAPLLLTIAGGSDEWRRERRYAHIAGRLDMASILADPTAPGRPYVLHATDETVTEFANEPYAADAPLHVVALRTAAAKYATYSNWSDEGIRQLGRRPGNTSCMTTAPRTAASSSTTAPGATPPKVPLQAMLAKRLRG